MLKDRLQYYANWVSKKDVTISSLMRFRNKPVSDFPQIYSPYESVLDHEVRLVTSTELYLSGILPEEDILEIQQILIAHDVCEIFDGDINRLSDDQTETIDHEARNNSPFLPGDTQRIVDFTTAINYLEGNNECTWTFHPLIARVLDTLDGNFYAFALLENYSQKVGGEVMDPSLQKLLDLSYKYVNKTRAKYRERIENTRVEVFGFDLKPLLEYLLEIEKGNIDAFSQSIESQGYRVGAVL